MAAMLSEDEFQRKLQSMQPREVKSQMKANAVHFSELSSASNNEAYTMESTTPRAKGSSYITSALLIWTDTEHRKFNHFAITKTLSRVYRCKKLNFVCTMVKDGEFTALIRIKDRLPDGPLLGTSEKDQHENLANFLHLASKEKYFEIIKTNLSGPEIRSKYQGLVESDSICAALGSFQGEHHGYRSDVTDQETSALNSYFGCIATSSPLAKHALTDNIFVERFTRILRNRALQTFYRPDYSTVSTASASSKCSDAAACASQAMSLWTGVNVHIIAQTISGSDVNNLLACLGVVAVGDDSFVVGRGALLELTSRGFLLEYVKLAKPNITKIQREVRIWKLPYGNFSSDELLQWRETSDMHEFETECLEQIKIKINLAKQMGIEIKVFLAELVKADTMSCLRGQFLNQLSKILVKNKIVFAVDDIMAGIRCGQPLSILLYGNPESLPFLPSLVTLGKLYGTSLLLSLNLTGQVFDRLQLSRGIVSHQFDEMRLCCLLEFIRVTAQHEVLEKVRTMPETINKHFHDFLSSHEGSFVCGFGAMLYTNIEMDPSKVDLSLLQYNRILPALNASVRDFQDLVPVGVNRAVVKNVSPDNIQKLKLLSEIWPDMASRRKASDLVSGPSKRRASSTPSTRKK
jgi:hypothetical protein